MARKKAELPPEAKPTGTFVQVMTSGLSMEFASRHRAAELVDGTVSRRTFCAGWAGRRLDPGETPGGSDCPVCFR